MPAELSQHKPTCLGWRRGWNWLLQIDACVCANLADSQVSANVPQGKCVTVLSRHKGLVPAKEGFRIELSNVHVSVSV